MTYLRDPITLCALLSLLLEASSNNLAAVVRECARALGELAAAPHLVVRTLARDILVQYALESPRFAFSEPLVSLAGEFAEVEKQVERFAANRISNCSDMLPELKMTVVQQVARRFADTNFKARLKEQLDALASRSEFHWPDAIVADVECIEEVLQRVGGAGRALSAARGDIIADPVLWERELARRMFNKPQLAVDHEMVREPRPELVGPPLAGDLVWTRIANNLPNGLWGVRASSTQLSATTDLGSLDKLTTVDAGKSRGWRVVAAAETRVIFSGYGNARQTSFSGKFSAIELHPDGFSGSLSDLPYGAGTALSWYEDSVAQGLPLSGALFVKDRDREGWGDHEAGLGVHSPVLAPSAALAGSLRLFPTEEPFELADALGPALRLRVWRTCYAKIDYRLARP